MGNLAVAPRSRKEIERIANNLRSLLDCTSLYFPILHLIELLSVPDEDGNVELNCEIVPDIEMPGEYATYSPVQNTIRIRESVYLGASRNNGRDRFTLAHELGHFILHRSQEYKFARVDHHVPTYQDPEWQANTFASMLLMPRHLIRGMDLTEVAEKCATSRQAAEIALTK